MSTPIATTRVPELADDYAGAVPGTVHVPLSSNAVNAGPVALNLEARRFAFDVLRQIVAITTDVFQGPVLIKESFNPEYPDEKYVVFVAEVRVENAAILALESQWRSRIAAIAPEWDGIRLLVQRQK